MIDYCLPRACEIIIDHQHERQVHAYHKGDVLEAMGDSVRRTEDGEETREARELVSCGAAIASNLARDSTVALEVLVFHANVLRRVVDILVSEKEYGLSGQLLRCATAFAAA